MSLISQRKEMYSIGKLAEMCNASIKQLRYLEKKGLLIPEMRHQDNNYRYYSQEQLSQLTFIKILRDLGLPFEDIVKILECGEEDFFIYTLKKRLATVENEISRVLQNYSQLTSYYTQVSRAFCLKHDVMRAKQDTPEIQIVEIPLCTAVFSRHSSTVSSRELFIDRFFELQKICQNKHLTPSSGMYAIFYDGWDKQFDGIAEDLEALFPVSGEPSLDKEIRRFGGFKGVSAVYVGDYKDMKDIYLQIFAWAQDNKLPLMEVSVEKYLLGPEMINDPQQYITQIIIPFAGSKL